MAKIKYTVKENKTVGTHSFYSVPVTNGTLTTDEIISEACANTSYEESLARGIFSEVMKAVQRNLLKGFRVNLGDSFIQLYPNLLCSVKDTKDAQGNVTKAATASMVKAQNGKSRLGCTVNAKYSQEFAASVQWQKVDANGVEISDDVTDDSASDSDDTTRSSTTTDGTTVTTEPSSTEGNEGEL